MIRHVRKTLHASKAKKCHTHRASLYQCASLEVDYVLAVAIKLSNNNIIGDSVGVHGLILFRRFQILYYSSVLSLHVQPMDMLLMYT